MTPGPRVAATMAAITSLPWRLVGHRRGLFWSTQGHQIAFIPKTYSWHREVEALRKHCKGKWTVLYYQERQLVAASTLKELKIKHITYLLTGEGELSF